MTVLGVAEFKPDSPAMTEATDIALNVVPLTPESYGPINAYKPYTTNSIDAVPRGMAFGEDSNLLHHVYAGTQTKLWTVTGTSTTWTDVTPATAPNAGLPGNESWHFAQHGNLMIATDFNDPVQAVKMTTGGAFQPLSAQFTPSAGHTTTIPRARYMAVAKQFLILANTWDTVGLNGPQRIWWSAANAPAWFPDPGSDDAAIQQSDYSDLVGPQGPITGLAPNLQGCDCAVFFERGVWRMNYTGPPAVFSFYPAMTQKGCIAPNSLCTLGTMAYYLGEDGFYQFDGYSAMPIGATKVDRFFYNDADPYTYDRIIGAPDIANKAIVWLYKSIGSTTMTPNRAIIYRWDLQRWSIANLGIDFISRVPNSVPGETPVVSGQLQLGCIGADRTLGYLKGPTLWAQVATKVVQVTPNARSFVNASRALIDLTSQAAVYLMTESKRPILTESGSLIDTETGVSAPAAFTLAISARNTYYDLEAWGPEVPPDVSGDCPQRVEGRYHRARITINPGGWRRVVGVDAMGIKSGIR